MYFWVPHLPFKDGGVGARAPSVSSHNHCNKLSERGFNMFVVQRERYKVSDSHSFQEGKKNENQAISQRKRDDSFAQIIWRRQVLIYYRYTLLDSECRQDRCCRFPSLSIANKVRKCNGE